jgi:hypothetical protein
MSEHHAVSVSPCVCILFFIFFHGSESPSKPGTGHYRGFTITLRYPTIGRTSLDEWSARRKDLHLTTQNNHKRQTSMTPAGFEPSIPASQQLNTHALDRAGAEIGTSYLISETNNAVLRNTGRSEAIGTATALQALRSGDRIPVQARFSAPIQTGPGTYLASCTMVIEPFSRG